MTATLIYSATWAFNRRLICLVTDEAQLSVMQHQQCHEHPVSAALPLPLPLPQAELMPLVSPLSPIVSAWMERGDPATDWPVSPLPYSAYVFPRDITSMSTSCASGSEGPIGPPASLVSASSPPPPYSFPHSSWTPAAAAVTAAAITSRLHTSAAHDVIVRHRSAEARRRRRENSALRRLEQLCDAEQGEGVERLPSASAGAPGQQRRTRDRQSVLEASAVRIERLEELLNVADLTLRVSEAQVQRLSDEVSGMVQRERQTMQWLEALRPLRGSSLLDSRFASTLMDCHSGRLLDANNAFFSLTGFSPGGVLQRVLDPVLGLSDTATQLSDVPLVRSRLCRNTDMGASNGTWSQMQWVPLRPLRQYPATVRAVRELLTAHVDDALVTFRSRWVNGNAYEFQAHVWVADAEWVEEADGSRCRRPMTYATAASIDNFRRLDEE